MSSSKYPKQDKLDVILLICSIDEELEGELSQAIETLNVEEYKTQRVENIEILIKELESYDDTIQPQIRRIIPVIDGTKDMGGLDKIRQVQSKFPEYECALVLGEQDEVTTELKHTDTFRLFQRPFKPETVLTAIRLAARKHRKTLRRQTALKSINEATNLLLESNDIDELYKEIVELAPNLVTWITNERSEKPPLCHFALMEEQAGVEVLKFHREHHSLDVWIKLNEADEVTDGIINLDGRLQGDTKVGIIGYAAKEKKAILDPDIREEKHQDGEKKKWHRQYIEVDPETRSQLTVPIFLDSQKRELLGLINLEHSEEGAFDEQDAEALQNFANQMSIAYEKHRQSRIRDIWDELNLFLNSDLQTITEEFIYSKVEEVATKLLSVSGTKGEFNVFFAKYMPALPKFALAPTDGYRLDFERINEEEMKSEDSAREILKKLDEDLVFNNTSLENLINRKQSFWTLPSKDSDQDKPKPNSIAGSEKDRVPLAKSMIAVWVEYNDITAGILVAYHHIKNRFSESSYKLLKYLANRISPTLEAFHYQWRLDLIHNAANWIYGTTNIEKVLQAITDQSIKAFKRNDPSMNFFVHIRMLDKKNNVLRLKAVSPKFVRNTFEQKEVIDISLMEGMIQTAKRKILDKRVGISGRAVAANKEVVVLDVKKNGDYICISEAIKAQISIPLRDEENEAIGVLSIETDNPKDLNTENLKTLNLLIKPASNALILNNLLDTAQRELTLRLNSIKEDHREARKRSRAVYAISAAASIIVFVVMMYLIIFSSRTGDSEIGAVELYATVATQIVSVLFFVRSDKADQRIDEYYNKILIETDSFKALLDTCDSLPFEERADAIKNIMATYKEYIYRQSKNRFP